MTTSNPPVARLQLGQLLRELREKAGKKRDDAAHVLECQIPKISKIETGRSTISAGDIRLLIDLYDINDDLAETVVGLAREARKRSQLRVPDWARRYVAMESIAESIRVYEAELVPGLMQTEDYVRAITRAANPGQDFAEIERMVSARLERQSLLTGSNPPKLSAVINEAVLRRPVGGASVMREQLRHMLNLTDLPSVTLQILPFDAGAHVAMGSPFYLLEHREPPGAQTVYIEDLASSDYLDSAPVIRHYNDAFVLLQQNALSETESKATLDKAIRQTK